MNCAKAFLFFFNFIYLGVAAALIYVAVWLIQTYGDYTKLTTDMYTLVPAGIIVGIGVLVLFTAILGCCGTCRENKCCLTIFFMFLLSILALEVAAGVLGCVYKSQAEDEVRKGLNYAESNYNSDNAYAKAFDALQRNLKCCGIDNPSDWVNTTYYEDHKTLPPSCCIKTNSCFISSSFDHFQKGCYPQLLEKFKEILSYIIGIGIGFGILQILGLVGACVVIMTSRDVEYLRLQDREGYQTV